MVALAGLVGALLVPSVAVAQSAAPPPPLRMTREVRTTPTAEVGVPDPAGLAYDPTREELVVAGPDGTAARLTGAEDLTGRLRLSDGDPTLLTYDPTTREVVTPEDPVGDAAGAIVTDEAVQVLDDTTSSIVTTDGAGTQTATPITGVTEDADLRGLAVNPEDGLTYTLDAASETLLGVDDGGQVSTTYDLGDVALSDPQAIAFAPSTDSTDDPDTTNVFIADAGAADAGGITEVSLLQVDDPVGIVPAFLVQRIDTSQLVPASPDPSGVVHLPGPDRMLIVDSEVDETTGAGHTTTNMWQLTRTGGVTATGATLAYTNEPTGVGYDPSGDRLFVSADSGSTIFVLRRGPDGAFGTADDVIAGRISTGAYGVTDTEDPEFDPSTGALFFADGVNAEVYRVDPADGTFGNGDDVVTHFDVGVHGALDVEGLSSDPDRGTLLVGDRRSRRIYEVTKTGGLVRVIDASGVSDMANLSGLATAPSTTGTGRSYWIVDRGLDNGVDPNENDGRMYEVAITSTGNTAPVVSSVTVDQTAPHTDDVLTVTVQASDFNGDALTYQYQWLSNGLAMPGRTGATLDLAGVGNGDRGDEIAVAVTVSDGVTTSTRTSPTVTVVNSPPVFAQDLPDRTDAEGASVSLTATASDLDPADSLVYEATGLPPGVTIDPTTGALSGTLTGDAAAGSPYSTAVTVRDNGVTDGPTTISQVQQAATDLADGTTLSLTLPRAPTPGNLLVAVGHYAANRTPTVPAGWTIATESDTAGETVVFHRTAAVGEPATVTLSVSGTPVFMSLAVFEYAGMHDVRTEVVDRTSVQSAADATTVSTGTTATTRQADELLVATVGLNATRTFANAWTGGFQEQTTTRRQTVAHRIVSTTGQYTTSESWDTAAGLGVGTLVTFRGRAGAPTDTNPGTATDTFTWTVTDRGTSGGGSGGGGGGGPAPTPTEEPTLPPSDTTPATPTGLTATATTTSADLDWADNTEAALAGYRVHRAPATTGPWTLLTQEPITGSRYRDTSAPAGTTSWYRVTAVDRLGAGSTPATTSVRRSAIVLRSTTSRAFVGDDEVGLARPAGAAPGDVLVASLLVHGTPTIRPPRGWTEVRDTANGSTLRQVTWVHTVGDDDGADDRWRFSGPTSGALAVLAYRGVDRARPVDTSAARASGSTTAVEVPALQTSAPRSVLVAAVGLDTADAGIWPPDGMAEQESSVQASGADTATLAVSDAVVPAAGDTGARVAATSRRALAIAHAVALRPSDAPDGEGLTVQRLYGTDRIATSVAVSRRSFPTARAAVLARADAFPDALAASTLASELGGPILLTSRRGLDPRVRTELTRLGVRDVHLVGGVAALAGAVADDLSSAGFRPHRIAGTDRYATAAAIARAVVEHGGPVQRVLLALGDRGDGRAAFPDALAASQVATRTRQPVLLVTPDRLPDATRQALAASLTGTGRVTVVGGTAAIGEAVLGQVRTTGRPVTRIAGADRYATAARLADAARAAGGSTARVWLVSGTDFPDALAAGPAAHADGALMLLTEPGGLPHATATWLQANARTVRTVTIVGGPAAVGGVVDAQVRSMTEAPRVPAGAPGGAPTRAVAGLRRLHERRRRRAL